ncbi:fibroleukin-like [Saccostrea cucullata]|uniref:fibroleukin-like n=1 Tax=Saccostrea cuccullata TaxID=36930 RepID=UPI002ED3EEA4
MITHLNGSQLYEIYDYFLVSNETDGYRISLGEGSGTLGNSMMPSNPLRGIHGMRFTTADRDKEYWVHGNCAVSHGGGGGWWYNDCHDAMLTGPYGKAEWNKPWYPVYYTGEQIKAVQMMIKRRNP